jgi:hypothetical protein
VRNRRWHNYSDVKVDSKWEEKLRTGVLKEQIYHPARVPYTVEHTYEPDWRVGNILIEAKGRFRESSEAAKYKWIRKALVDEELVFLFMKPNTPMPHAKKRKDGTKQTHAEWAERNGFRWFTEETIRDIL